jgi:23S rRNA (cytosine1962-C5)-methyltransferase
VATTARIFLKAGKEKSVLRFHPWVFSNAISRIEGDVEPGGPVEVFSQNGDWLAWGLYSPQSQIRIRLWSWKRAEPIDRELLRKRIRQALFWRNSFMRSTDTNCLRLIHAESDNLPGLIVDCYDQYLLIQILHWGVEYFQNLIIEELLAQTSFQNIYERSDGEIRKLEGLEERVGVRAGKEPPETVQVIENGFRFKVDVRKGHKTGFYLDQKANRLRVMHYAKDREVLDCFSYTGGMTLAALMGGAQRVTCIDESSEALELLKSNLELNRIPRENVDLQCADVFQKLREFRDRGKFFDMIILDPPKFAPTAAYVSRASRGYKDINLLAMKLLRENGILVTFSCSGGVNLELFQKIIFGAAMDAKRSVRILEYLHQAPDHPVGIHFPEGAYLKGLILAVD